MWGFVVSESEMKKLKKAIQTFIGQEATLEGKLVFEGTVRLDGHFTGSDI